MIEVGGNTLAGHDFVSDVWSKIPRSETIPVRVERGGRELSIQLSCHDDAEAWRARSAIFRAVADAQWQACVDAIQVYSKLTRIASAAMLRVAVECMRERSKAARQSLPDEYWRTLHAWATKAIEESRYVPSGLSEIRSNLLGAAEALEKNGHASLANDIRQQTVAFSFAPTKP